MWPDSPRHIDRASQVGVENRVEIDIAGVLEQVVAHDAGVVDQGVDLPKLFQCQVDQPLRSVGICDAVMICHSPSPGALDLGNHRIGHRPRSAPPRDVATQIVHEDGTTAPEAPLPAMSPPRSFTTAVPPRLAISSAYVRPMPPPAPVTTTTRPSNEMLVMVSPHCLK